MADGEHTIDTEGPDVSSQAGNHFDVPDARPFSLSTETITAREEQLLTIEVTQDMKKFEYNMEHKHRGLAIIFNHSVFKKPSLLKERVGTEKDVEALRECLPMLGFEPDNIIVENNLTKKKIFDYLMQLSGRMEEVLANCDCLAIFILSHGSKNNRIYACDRDYDLYDLVEQYTPDNLEELAGKPKLFFIQACRGENVDRGFHAKFKGQGSSHIEEHDETDSVPLDEIVSHPGQADILISMSSYHDHFSFRNKFGSWYIQDLCNSIRHFHKEELLETADINDIILYTHHLVSQRESSTEDTNLHKTKQIPNSNSSLCRKLYFKKKN